MFSPDRHRSSTRLGTSSAAADLPVRPGHLDHGDTLAGEVAGECGAVAAGAFDADLADFAEAAQPVEQPAIAGG